MSKQEGAMDASQVGKGNWAGFNIPLDKVYEAAAEWRQTLAGVARPWLCWNVSDRWCKLQQRLILEVGWTPVIGFDPRSGPPTVLPGSVLIDFNSHFGFDPRSGPPTVLPGSILIDFNSHFGLGVMWPHFPLEFAFLFADRLAFWHADLLCRLDVMRRLQSTFESLPDGALAAVPDYGGRRNLLKFRHHRYWELVGCTTKSASESQF